VKDMEGIFKLSQNRDATSYHQIIDKLDAKDDDDSKAIAQRMKDRIQHL